MRIDVNHGVIDGVSMRRDVADQRPCEPPRRAFPPFDSFSSNVAPQLRANAPSDSRTSASRSALAEIGVATVLLNYALCPEVSIAEIENVQARLFHRKHPGGGLTGCG